MLSITINKQNKTWNEQKTISLLWNKKIWTAHRTHNFLLPFSTALDLFVNQIFFTVVFEEFSVFNFFQISSLWRSKQNVITHVPTQSTSTLLMMCCIFSNIGTCMSYRYTYPYPRIHLMWPIKKPKPIIFPSLYECSCIYGIWKQWPSNLTRRIRLYF